MTRTIQLHPIYQAKTLHALQQGLLKLVSEVHDRYAQVAVGAML